MTYSDSRPRDGDDVSLLLQPYVDGELSGDDQARVVAHLESSAEARHYVREQQEVRTLLRAVDTDRAPQALRQRILAELDHVDAERAATESQAGDGGKLVRLRAAFRGAMIMMPAAAAAVGLFFVVKSGALVDPESAAPLQGNSAALIDRADSPVRPLSGGTAGLANVSGGTGEPDAEQLADAEPESAAPPGAPIDLDLDAIDFPTDFTPPASLPEGVRLVSASRDSAKDANGALTVEYVDRTTGARYVDQQRGRSGVATPSGDGALSLVREGTTYTLWRDAAGRPLVRFDDGRVEHLLRHRGGNRANVGAPVDADAPGFRELLDLARSVERR